MRFLVVLAVLASVFAQKPPLAMTPQQGWNSWNKFGCDVSEQLLIETMDAIVSLGLKDLGYNYVNVDDCWQAANRDDNGLITFDSSRFPNGMKYLSDYAHSKGLKFGLYSSAGFKTCQGLPASLGRELDDAKKYAEWEVDYLKYDNCYTDNGVAQNRYKQMALALQASGRDILFSLCDWGRENPSVWGPEFAHSWRISGDINASWKSILTRAEIASSLWRYSGPGGWADPDMLECGNGDLSLDENKYHFALWAMIKSPLIIGNDIRNMTQDDDVYSVIGNAEIIAINQDTLGRQARRVYSDKIPSKEESGVEHLIATKCTAKEGNTERYEDAWEDQQWALKEDGTIRSSSTGKCLHEFIPKAESDQSKDEFNPFAHDKGIFGVGAVDCAFPELTTWKTEQFIGGSIVSQKTGRCLEVNRFDELPIAQGKRIQTGQCENHPLHQGGHNTFFDVTEHQSFTNPAGTLLNLYQRQCLTVNRDAPPGISQDIWLTPLSDGSVAVMVGNKGFKPNRFTVTWDMLSQGWPANASFKVRDLWAHEDWKLPQKGSFTVNVPSHGAAMLKLTPI